MFTMAAIIPCKSTYFFLGITTNAANLIAINKYINYSSIEP